MTVNTQEMWDLLDDFGNAAQGRDWETDAQAAAQNYSNKAANLWRGIIALLDENKALRAELQARQWMPIESCPRQHGKHYLICKDCGPGSLPSISIGFCFDDQKDWHLMDSNCTAEMYGYRVTHWRPLPLPPAPPQGESA